MRWIATGLLVVMASLLLFAHWAMREIDPAFTWLRAFAEAALVGGLADWFAVTALFRHPLGLPIPHTAIIPRKKDRIGEALAAFLRQNFLTPSVVARRMKRARVSAVLADLLRRPEAGGRLRRGVVGLARQLVRSPAADAVAQRLREAAERRLRYTDWPTLAAALIEAATRDGRHQALVERGLGWAASMLDAEEDMVRAMVRSRAGWMLSLVGLDQRLADEIVAGLRGLLAELAADPEHPLRARALVAVEEFADDLRHDHTTRERAARAIHAILDSPELARFLDGLFDEARERLDRLGEGPSAGRFALALADTLDGDPRLAADLDQLASRAAVGLVFDHGDAIVALVSETVGRWDAETVAAKLEQAVGRDLQYIRLNGTLIGGCIGVGLHAIIGLLGF